MIQLSQIELQKAISPTFLPRPSIAGNPSIDLWEIFRQMIWDNIIEKKQRPSTEEELSDFLDNLPKIKGIGSLSYVEATKWLQSFWNIQPES